MGVKIQRPCICFNPMFVYGCCTQNSVDELPHINEIFLFSQKGAYSSLSLSSQIVSQ